MKNARAKNSAQKFGEIETEIARLREELVESAGAEETRLRIRIRSLEASLDTGKPKAVNPHVYPMSRWGKRRAM